LKSSFFADLSREWQRGCALRGDYARRQALLEIDVLVSQSLGLTVEQLITTFRVQFPVMRQYDRDTWYDARGKVVFTSSKGLVGIGLPRKAARTDRECTIEHAHRTECKRVGWEDVRDFLADTRIRRTILDDTVVTGPIERIVEYVAPFTTADREHDYRIAWAEFERRAAADVKT